MANTDKFKNKYRIPSARLASWDYGTNAAYFVTICTADKVCYFGTIVETHDHASLPPQTQYTPLGMAAVECWNEIPVHFPFVELGEFVIMPNHVHGVIIINKPVGTVETRFVETRFVETQDLASLRRRRQQTDNPQNKFGPQSKNLASIIRGYKIGVTKFSRQNNLPFAWQPRYHDRVIRNDAEHERINQYIRNNVQNWAEDELNNYSNR